eukprot:gene8804-752_t
MRKSYLLFATLFIILFFVGSTIAQESDLSAEKLEEDEYLQNVGDLEDAQLLEGQVLWGARRFFRRAVRSVSRAARRAADKAKRLKRAALKRAKKIAAAAKKAASAAKKAGKSFASKVKRTVKSFKKLAGKGVSSIGKFLRAITLKVHNLYKKAKKEVDSLRHKVVGSILEATKVLKSQMKSEKSKVFDGLKKQGKY